MLNIIFIYTIQVILVIHEVWVHWCVLCIRFFYWSQIDFNRQNGYKKYINVPIDPFLWHLYYNRAIIIPQDFGMSLISISISKRFNRMVQLMCMIQFLCRSDWMDIYWISNIRCPTYATEYTITSTFRNRVDKH